MHSLTLPRTLSGHFGYSEAGPGADAETTKWNSSACSASQVAQNKSTKIQKNKAAKAKHQSATKQNRTEKKKSRI